MDDITKSPHSKTKYTQEDLDALAKCMVDPMYFMRTFMKVQHPIKGALPFEPYPFQERIINGIHDHRFTAVLTARQMGKCSTFDTSITKDGGKIKIGDFWRFSAIESLICLLEKWLLMISIL